MNIDDFEKRLKEALPELKNINTYLTQISKINQDLTKTDLSNIGKKSFTTASKYGKSATDYLSDVQDMFSAGYKNSEALAELSLSAQNAGDMTAEIANRMIIATDTAYNMEGSVKKLTEALDGINVICDNNNITMSDLSEGMSIVGTTAASIGVDVSQLTAALATMASATHQSGADVANTFKTILLNIKQVSDEEEGINANGLAKYEKACNALGVSLKETKNGISQTRDAMDVLEDLSKAYNKLSSNDVRKENLLSSLGEKSQATQFDALLTHYEDTYKLLLEQFADGQGTMAKEAQISTSSWEGSLNRLSNTWTNTVYNITDSDAIVTAVNALNSLLTVANKFTNLIGSWGSIGIVSGLSFGKGESKQRFCPIW